MRIGFWRGLTLAATLVSGLLVSRTASADGFHYTIPREVLARDLNTGGPYFAPPIPYGHYAKDGFMSCLHGGYFGKSGHCCGLFGCGGCGLGCGLGKGLGHGGGNGCGSPGCGGLFSKCGHGHGGDGGGCGLLGKGCGLFGHGASANACNDSGCGGFGHAKRFKNCGLCKGNGCGVCTSSGPGMPIHTLASSQSPAPVMVSPQGSPQGVIASGSCGDSGCHIGGKHKHLGHGNGGFGNGGCGSCGGGLCGGKGCGLGHGGNGYGDPCGSCFGKGCGKCNFLGFLHNKGGNGCGACGGAGCGLCSKLKGLAHGSLLGLFHHNKIKYFVGAGGPIPLTPGYTPYVVTTRSPRDFFSFPPYTPEAP